MRLIDVDKIEINEECTFSGKGIKAFLDAIPTAYDVDKVAEQLRNEAGRWEQSGTEYEDKRELGIAEGIRIAEKIVKPGGIE